MRNNIDKLLGKTIIKINITMYNPDNNDNIIFKTSDGYSYKMYHEQDCYERVTIDDIVGDLNNLIDNPLLIAEEVTSDKIPAKDPNDEHYTWTFYRFATIKGHVNIKWYGGSNGYYSERVTIVRDNKDGSFDYYS